MEKRTRSPNYPAMSLREAVQKVGDVYRKQHTHGAPREVVVQSMGYSSLNGASATAISALVKFGLLEGRGDEVRISPLAMAILHPESPGERARALQEAAALPSLYTEIGDKFPGRAPSDEVLRNFLIRRGFAASAVGAVVEAYRDTKEFVSEAGSVHDSLDHTDPVEETQTHMHASSATAPPPSGEIEVGALGFKGVGSVRIMASPDLDPHKALTMAETVITMMRAELASRHKAIADQRGVEKENDS